MVRRPGLRDRLRGDRHATLYVVATEGEKTEPAYFEALQTHGVISRTRVKVKVLPTQGGLSAPNHVLDRLKDFEREYSLDAMIDQLWVVLDVDRWGPKLLADVATRVSQGGYQLAASNPCFELWLLLHFADAPWGAVDVEALEAALRVELGAYSKTSIQAERYSIEAVRDAIRRADALRSGRVGGWPSKPGTDVDLLVRGLIPTA